MATILDGDSKADDVFVLPSFPERLYQHIILDSIRPNMDANHIIRGNSGKASAQAIFALGRLRRLQERLRRSLKA